MKASIIFSFLFFIGIQNASACTGRFVNPVTDICWDCIFPISIGATQNPAPTAFRPDTKNYPSPICVCPNERYGGIPTPGLAVGYWEPIRMVDVTKNPFCMVSLGGMELAPSGISLIGAGTDDKQNNATWHLHWYISPMISILNIISEGGLCGDVSVFDLAYLTELDPLWHNDLLSFIINPESILFANPIAQAACAFDCTKTSVSTPVDSLFWCAGCQSSLYPFTGNISGQTNSIQGTTMVIEKFIAKLHRQMQLMNTSGPEAICMPKSSPLIKKSQYRFQTAVPIAGIGPFGCNTFGKSTFFHEMGKEIPITGEDFGYMVWRKKTCCIQ